MSISSAKQSKDQEVCFVIQSNIPENSINKDMHYEGTKQMGAEKYLRESCYHRIEYSVTNSLATLMRKWCLNNTFQPYSYSQRLQEGADGTMINTNNLMYMWRVEIKERREYKIERRPRWKGIGEWRKKYCSNKSCTCNWLQELYTRTDLLGLCWGRFILNKTGLFLLYCYLDPL